MKAILYVDREDFKKVEEEERNKFVKGVLQSCGIPLDEVWPNLSISVEEKIALRKLLGKYDTFILGQAGSVEIYVKDELIGQWLKPKCRLRIDDREMDPAKKLYLEMTIECSSVFDEDDLVQEEQDVE